MVHGDLGCNLLVLIFQKERKVLGKRETFKGDPNFWRALDNSFEPETV